MNIRVKGVDLTDPLEEKKDKVIDSFVELYGEEYRPLIQQKINGMTFFFVPRMNGNQSIGDLKNQWAGALGIKKSILAVTIPERFQEAVKWLKRRELDRMIDKYYPQHKKIFEDYNKKLSEEIMKHITSYKKNLEEKKGNVVGDNFSYEDAIKDLTLRQLVLIQRPFKWGVGIETKDAKEYIAAYEVLGETFEGCENDDQKLQYLQKLYSESSVNNLRNDVVEKLIKNDPYLKDVAKTLDSLDIRGGKEYIEYGIERYTYLKEYTAAYAINYIEDKTAQLKTICVFPDATKVKDSLIMHEINHCIESVLLDAEMGIAKSGFDIVGCAGGNPKPQTKDVMTKRDKPRKYEKFSEIVNTWYEKKATEILHSKGVTLGLNQEEDNSEYSKGLPFFRDFIEDNFDIIKKSRTESDTKYSLDSLLGEDLSNELCEIADNILIEFDQETICADISQKTGRKISSFEDCVSLKNDLEVIKSLDGNSKKLFEYMTKIDGISKVLSEKKVAVLGDKSQLGEE